MKKALIIPILLIVLCACTRQEYGILPYQQKNIEATLNVNEEFKIKLTKTEKTSLEILEPEGLKGMSFILEENGILARNGDTEIMLDKKKLDGIYAIGQIFSLNEASLTTAENNQFSFEQNDTHYKLTLGKNDLPKEIEISSNSFYYEITVEAIRLN